MNIYISANATNGHLIVYLINSNGIKILELRDTENGECMLVPNQTYRFEWHVWSPLSADYSIDAKVVPLNDGFKPFNWQKSYQQPHQDMGGFYFSV